MNEELTQDKSEDKECTKRVRTRMTDQDDSPHEDVGT